MRNEAIAVEKRAEWRAWAQKELGDDERKVEVATSSVIDALVAGHTVEDAMEIAREAARGSPPEAVVSDERNLRGRVAVFRERNEQMGSQYGSVWSFRVDHWDQSGKSLPPVNVEMRGLTFDGSIGEGDWVEIPGRWKAGELNEVQALRNVSMNADVVASGAPSREGRALGKMAKMIIFVVLAVVMVWIFAQVYLGAFAS